MDHDKQPQSDPLIDRPRSNLGPDDPPIAELAIDEADARSSSEGVIRSGKLAGKSMWAAIWILAIPVLVQQMMAACVGLFDKVVAGSLRDEIVVAALDGLGIGAFIGWFIGIAMTGVGIGGQALIARAIGAGDRAEGEHALAQSMSLSVIWGVVVGVFLWLIAAPMASACQLSDNAAMYCVQYIQILAFSMPMCAIMMVGAMCLHGAGETTKPSVIAIQVNIVNIIGSWMFSGADIRLGDSVFVNPFSFDMDVRGIALGTALGYAWGGAMTLYILFRGVKDLKLHSRQLPMEGSMIRRIVKVGIPNFMEGISMWAVNIIILMFIGIIMATTDESEGLQGAHIIAIQWEAFSFLPGFAIGIAAGALAGQYLGAGNPRMAAKAVLACTGVAVVAMGLLGLVFMYGGTWLTAIVSDKPVHLEHTPKLLFICGTMQIFFAITMVVRQGMRGVGDTTWTFIITTVSSYGVRMPAAYLLGVMLELGLEGIWYALCGEFFVRAALFCARFFHGGWKRIKV